MTREYVDYRYGDHYWVNEFIQPHNFEVERVANGLGCNLAGDGFSQAVVSYIRDSLKYPLDSQGQPATDGEQRRYKRWIFKYLWNTKRYYVWAFPAQVIVSGYGYCAESANLCTSLLRSKGIPAWTVIGEVRKPFTDELLGYHAWTVVLYKGQEYVIETTIHNPASNPLILKDLAYDEFSSFAREGIYYVEHARYNEEDYTGLTELGKSEILFQLLGKPNKLLNVYGMERLKELPARKVYKEWRKEEKSLHLEISRVFGGVRW